MFNELGELDGIQEPDDPRGQPSPGLCAMPFPVVHGHRIHAESLRDISLPQA